MLSTGEAQSMHHVSRSYFAGISPLVALFACPACSTAATRAVTDTGSTGQALTDPDGGSDASATSPGLVPCAAWSYAALAHTGNLILNASTLVGSYQSSASAYGGTNVGNSAVVQAATTITNNGGVVNRTNRSNTAGGFSVVPVPAGATNLPLGSHTSGALNINTAADSMTIAPGNYVAANMDVNFPGSINISPPGQVRIWVTGGVNLGGTETSGGVWAPIPLSEFNFPCSCA